MSDKAGVTGAASTRAQKAAFDEMITRCSPPVQKLARAARALVLDVMPGVIETVWAHQGTSSYGTGPKKLSEHFVYFTFAKDHLGFGFYYGAELPDPAGLLEGSGKSMRRVKISSADDLKNPSLRALVVAASTHRVPKLA